MELYKILNFKSTLEEMLIFFIIYLYFIIKLEFEKDCNQNVF